MRRNNNSRASSKVSIRRLSLRNLMICFAFLLGFSVTAKGQITVQYEKDYSNTQVGWVDTWDYDDNGAIYLCGGTVYVGSHYAFRVTRLDSMGSIDWQREFTGFTTLYSGLGTSAIAVDPNGDVVAAGLSYDRSAGYVDAARVDVMKYDSDGTAIWGPVSIDLYPYDLTTNVLLMDIDESGFIYIAAMPGDSSSTPEGPDNRFTNTLVAGIDPSGAIVFVDIQKMESLKPPLENEMFIGDNSATFLTTTLVDSLSCEWWEEWYIFLDYRASLLSYSHGGYQGKLSGPWNLDSCSIDHSCSDPYAPRFCWTMPQDWAVRPDGSMIIALECGYSTETGALLSLTSDGDLDWYRYSEPYALVTGIVTDAQGNTIAKEKPKIGQHFLGKYDRSGNQLWESPVVARELAVDDQDRIYVLGFGTITVLNPETGAIENTCPINLTAYPYEDMVFDTTGILFVVRWYIDGVSVGLYRTTKQFEILDAAADSNPITEREFEFYKTDTAQPGAMIEHVGSFASDQDGVIEFKISEIGELMYEDVGTGLDIGDLASISIHVKSEPAPRHPIVLPTKYNVWLDPIQFDEYGLADLASIDNQSIQEYILNHTEYRYNLLVSVEWDADQVYLDGLQSEFRYMSNYLYDVTDGQIRLDTVAIFDDKLFWSEADVRILAVNSYTPKARVWGINLPGAFSIQMPRKYFGAYSRDWTYYYHPLANVVSTNFRALAHEFGHYALGFRDEYEFYDPAGAPLPSSSRCLERPDGNYGFMDCQQALPECGVYASEMSSAYRYFNPDCQNTEQWVKGEQRSCWDAFELWAEGTFNNIYVPILKPDVGGGSEHQTPEGLEYIPGPNDDMDFPDFNIGAHVVFPFPPTPPADGVRSVHVEVPGAPTSGVNVYLRQRDEYLALRGIIEQGKTNTDKHIYVLGAGIFDDVWASGHSWRIIPASSLSIATRSAERVWKIGDADLTQGISLFGGGAGLSPSADSLTLTLYEVDGYFPMICNASIAEDALSYSLEAPAGLLPAEPVVELTASDGGSHTSPASATPGGYEAIITDSLGPSGTITVLAVDNSAHGFFFVNNYVLSPVTHDSSIINITGPNGVAELTLDTINSSIDSVLMLSSPYLVPLNGLAEDVAQAGETISLSVWPNVQFTGVNSLVIPYTESDLGVGDNFIGDESALQIYKWNYQAVQWDIVGGYVDTLENYVASSITEMGTYAAFTTHIITDVEEDEYGDILPYRFELSQNYPNPFNLMTTIKYNLPRQSSIRIDIFNLLGQKVQTLVNREESAGSYSISWDGTNSSGVTVPTGVYFYRFQAGDHVETKKMLLLK